MIIIVLLKNSQMNEKFIQGIKRFQREDPTFVYSTDEETKVAIIIAMGELHLQIYIERFKREYGVEIIVLIIIIIFIVI